MSKLTNTANRLSPSESKTDSLSAPPSSLTCVSSFSPVQLSNTEELRTWLAGAFPVRTYQSRGGAQESTESAADCGQPCGTLFATFDREKFTWKTAQQSLFEDSSELQTIWPKWGTASDGECWALTMLEESISENAGGVLLPTPLADDWKGGTASLRNGKPRTDQFRHYVKIEYGWTYPNPDHSETVMGWPIGWSALEPLETARFQSWLQQHTGY